MRPNKKNDIFFNTLVKEKVLKISDKGSVFNNNTGREIGYVTNKGYKAIGFRDETKKVKHILVHRLVYLIYGKGDLEGVKVINHKDGDKLNNDIDNLEAVTDKENSKHARENGLIPDFSEKTREILKKRFHGQKGNNAVLTNKEAVIIREKYEDGYSQRELAGMFNVGKTTIWDVVNRQTFKNV